MSHEASSPSAAHDARASGSPPGMAASRTARLRVATAAPLIAGEGRRLNRAVARGIVPTYRGFRCLTAAR
jgi:hypothetical protein